MAPVPPNLMPPNAAPKGLWRRTPPAIFPPTLGLLGLALAWRKGAVAFDLPAAVPDILIGAVTLFSLFALLTYGAKLAQRPGAAMEDLKILPGRAGLSAAVLCLYLLAAATAPYALLFGQGLFFVGVVAHLVLTVALIITLIKGPPEQRRVTPAWHLSFSGWIVAAMAAAGLGYTLLATGLFWLALVIAVVIWTISLQQFARESVPAPLRPLLAIHLAPAAVIGTTAASLGGTALAQVFGIITGALLVIFLARALWLLKAGFSPFWGALTFPMAATASLWLSLGGPWRLAGAAMLVAATLAILPIAYRIFQMWAKGQLAAKTGASVA
ncbi:tellurite resistance protein [Rhodobacter aestuarii]|uniref:Tellurite resistance protein n=1 Tax=Rhodobacter aestuarii TaxID=453582 RepID=A0A1N7J6P8_9RHOB|nr:hypothetical protein [Rhodobacter aestuarii]PTV97125.1 tellurite resistance protein [Rhodobacter aestuarii]SIS44982.1 tellurite resistance protein [Rhodobacter aestuarii]